MTQNSDSPITNNLPVQFVPRAELPKYGIDFTPKHQNELSDKGTFPPPYNLSPGRVAYKLADIELWLNTRPQVGERMPVLWPLRKHEKGRGQPGGAISPGRPRGSRVVKGKLIRPEPLEDSAPLAAAPSDAA